MCLCNIKDTISEKSSKLKLNSRNNMSRYYYKKSSISDKSLSKDAPLINMKLFIVEDDKIQSLILEMMVKKLGINHIGTEAYGEDAVSKILSDKPDIVLLDVMLKDSFNGIDVAKKITQVYKPTIIYITGNSDEAHKTRAQEHGFHDFITKPISMFKLKESIESIQAV